LEKKRILIKNQNNKDFKKECICCDEKKLDVYKSNSNLGFPIHLCKNCSLYIAGRFENEMKQKTQEIYNSTYWEERKAKEAMESNYTNHYSLILRVRWQSQKNFCEPFIYKKKNLLEIGAGRGQNLYFFQKEGFKVTGVEPDKNNVNLINQKLKPNGFCHVGFAEAMDISDKFDIVWMSHVLEHVVRPDLVFKKIHDLLNPNGLFFVEVPNCECFEMVKLALDNNPSTYGFTKKSLIYLGKKFGFEEIKSGYNKSYTTYMDKASNAMKKFFKINLARPPFHYKNANPKEAINLRILFKKI